jgi:acetyl esterase/lipase
VPDEQKALPIARDDKTGTLPDLDDPRFSPVNGLDVLAQYKECLERVTLTSFIGTNDILYPQNVRMQERLTALGAKSELHVVSCRQAPIDLGLCLYLWLSQYEGLFHVFPLLPWLPESMDAFEKIRALFA